MKNILITALVLVANFCSAQVLVNQIDVNKFDYQYLEVWEHYNNANGKFYAMIDYGQIIIAENGNAQRRVNENNGQPKEFNSIVSILNFLHRNGWELVTIKTTGEIDSFIMKRIDKMKPSGEVSTAENNNN